ncbi:esterase-like activity of phytase family protein [Ottowia sp. SB7-C50]|uniref:esterase-like activity of phytase family protein n=1 Tax=Ottowia sp. SB7-C50 TaxID=3081231 RepID=UPI002954BF11|nr:esterase-like activity of phytase family protein [Ottowia sp. SB7-C50]WOP15191.1 esterase-like activity of phytase family protein [Ottowia sp. SB7-C50]
MVHPNPTAFRLHRRQWLGMALSAAGLLAAPASKARTPARRAVAPALRLLAHGSLSTGTEFKGTLVGGLSGLAYDAQNDLWYALSDDRSRHAPARCYVFRLPPLTTQPLLPQWVDVITLLGADGKPFARHAVDPEGLALRRDPATGSATLLWTSEGDIRAQIAPALYESALDGRLLRTFTLPDALRELGRIGRGPRHNETLEGLALTPNGQHAWTAMEGALAQDRDGLTPGAPPGPCRLTRFDVASGRADRQVAYLPEARPFGPLMPMGGVGESGISEIIVRDNDHLWVLERAWTPATGVSARLYEADLRHASDTLAVDALTGRRYRPCAKRLLLDLRQCGLPHVDNFEAMAWGPRLPNGHRTLVMCTDDNFNPLQVTQFIALEAPPPLRR